MEVEAVDEGTLGKILVPEGTEDVAVNTPIAVILADGESAADLGNGAPAPQPDGREAGAPPGSRPKRQTPRSAGQDEPSADGAGRAGRRRRRRSGNPGRHRDGRA